MTIEPQRHDFRCHACSKLIAKVSDVVGVVVEAKCPRCGEVTEQRLEVEDAPAAS